ncbi:YciI family protein [Mucilaginibacter segetis]|uniref:Transcription initiation protein n=1 Tax=Mucilaginibacter segetis TaxID=2793071 RepID=A0A934UPP4_9SPHI|nr:YciI family protein [Mucilaginibacter segetis]MBK0381096.1 transcription initiation protein [Mucilaginibacter segetis]
MKDYLLIFRADFSKMLNSSEEEKKAMTQKYMDWIGDIANKGNLANQGNRLAPTGRIVSTGNLVTDGPFTETKEFIGGYSMIKADSYEQAVAVTEGCPVFILNGKVEIREVMTI